jgi:hypothetical protein
MLEDLLVVVPEERKGAVEAELTILVRTVERAFPDIEDRGRASVADQQGLGSSRSHAARQSKRDPVRAYHDALALAGVKHLVPFHHDPGREDAALEAAVGAAVNDVHPEFPVTPAAEGARFDLG